MVGHTGFLMGLVAVVIAIILAYLRQSILTQATLTLLSFSLVILLFAAERFSEALDFDDQRRHLGAINLYNAGVALLMWGMGALMLAYNYFPPMIILFVSSLWWVREIVRSWRLMKPRRKQGK